MSEFYFNRFMPYNPDSMDGGMFNPRVLDSMQQQNLDYVRNNTPNATQRIKNLLNSNSKQYSEVVYDQNYVNNLLVQIQGLTTELNIANQNILEGNKTIERLDGLVDNLKIKLSQYQN